MKILIFFCFFICSSYGNAQTNSMNSITDSCIYKEYTLSLNTCLLNDSVITNELLWQKPIVIRQEISLFKKGHLLKKIEIKNNQLVILTKDGLNIDVSQIPIIDVAFVKGEETFIYLYGALNCNGINCPEYLGIYDLSGNKCIDYISTDINNQHELFEKFISKYGIVLENRLSQISIVDKLVW